MQRETLQGVRALLIGCVLGVTAGSYAAQDAAPVARPDAEARGSGQAAPNARAATPRVKKFIETAARGNHAEIAMGQLAQRQGVNEAVRDFGRMLVDDHRKANDALRPVAEASGVVFPDEAKHAKQRELKQLEGMKGAAFDQRFASGMVKAHRKTIQEYEQARDIGDERLRRYVDDTLPTLRKHLETAQALEARINQASR